MSGGVLFEFVQMGQVMRVAAIDEVTGTEVFVITPVSATRLQMERVALAKLKRKLGEPEETREPPKPGRYA
ncbi:hypothetical protein JP75_08830 [Devosia riboflavina]|uniref:DUF6898 domain-containing protein n=1 Tax=Devosia riboflavina TaxID=46914 RepID=A0A087M417_9HYPH|nr:hypothetical protein [Devosia riboflavina]KFL31620.1 hypothetical protein JP75_08830 [Devosia riboflavina]